MHSLLKGACKTYFHRVLALGEHGSVADTVVAPEGGGNGAGGDDEVQLVQENETASSTTPSSTRRKKMSPTDITCLQEALRLVTTPSSVSRLHDLFGSTSGGSPTANHWRVFATVFGPLVLPPVFLQRGRTIGGTRGNSHLSSEDLDAMMSIFEIISIALKSSIRSPTSRSKHLRLWFPNGNT